MGENGVIMSTIRKRRLPCLLLVLLTAAVLCALTACMRTHAEEPASPAPRSTREVMPDTWVFTDGLGRVSLTNADVGDPREDRTLAMFYWTWHVELADKGAVNTTELMKQYPAAKNDYDHPAWERSDRYCFWNEPIWGFYRTDDPWVLRRQAELLANAGVDVIFTDNTNGAFTWQSSYTALYRAWDKARRQGVNTPKVSYLLPFGSSAWHDEQVRSIYEDIYAKGKYKELWFYWDGKPMLMGYDDTFTAAATASDRKIGQFFTWRGGYSGYINQVPAAGLWGWLSTYPQAVYSAPRKEGELKRVPEQMSVGVAQNHSYVTNEITAMNGENVMGRSYTSDYPDRYQKEGAAASLWGYNFAEQFERALKIDPKVIFVTGWNEWHASRQKTPWGGDASKVQNALPDQFDNEHSRDIEPTKGELKDHYYYQLVNFVRQYKGVRPIPTPSANVTIDLDGDGTQWDTVEPYFAAYEGNTTDRYAQGYGTLIYTERSGRNDLVGAQLARDDAYLYFRVECAEDITPRTDAFWMTLYLDTDQEKQGWNTFDFVVNRAMASEHTLRLDRFTADNDYAKVQKVADVEYKLDGRYMTVKIAKADLGITGDDYTVNFAWTDNVHDEGDPLTFSGDIMDFYISGDVAPGGRFKYSFVSTRENAGKSPLETLPPAESVTDPVTVPDTDPTAPATDAPGTDGATDPTPSSEGCHSGLMPATILLLTALGAAHVLRKKPD